MVGCHRYVGVITLAMLAMMPGGCATTRCMPPTSPGNLGITVNSPLDDYAPALPDTAMLVFTSTRIDPETTGLQEALRRDHPGTLYFSMRLDKSFDAPAPYRPLLSEEWEGIATIAFMKDNIGTGTIAITSACGRKNAVGGCDLYTIVDGEAGGLFNPGTPLNSTDWDGHPFVTNDGSRLYFASDRDGGHGGTDIWIADHLPGGAWDTPRNAGSSVNTAGDELSPFIDAATGTLYFAATTANRGIDIFTLRGDAVERTPLAPPYNSNANDFTPWVVGETIYLASNRDGGCGGYDLYRFPMR